jgi:hypothetical protein
MAVDDACHGRAAPSWSLRRRVVHAAACEWDAFGRPVVTFQPEAALTDAPAVLGLSPAPSAGAEPGTEDEERFALIQLRFGRQESDLSVWARVARYWDRVDAGHAADVRRAAALAGQPELYPAWRRPWSAAFISWVMARAGETSFTGSPSHSTYLHSMWLRRPDRLIPIEQYAPAPGDLVCAARDAPIGGAEFLQRLQDWSGHFDAHCDVVVQVEAGRAILIGGNVRNTAAATVTPIRDGRLVRTAARPWAVAMRLDAPPDPCAALGACGPP